MTPPIPMMPPILVTPPIPLAGGDRPLGLTASVCTFAVVLVTVLVPDTAAAAVTEASRVDLPLEAAPIGRLLQQHAGQPPRARHAQRR